MTNPTPHIHNIAETIHLIRYAHMQHLEPEDHSLSGKSVAMLELDAYQWMTRMSPLVLDTPPSTKNAAKRHLADLQQQLQTGRLLQQDIATAELNPSIVMSIDEAIIGASAARFRPILMTSLSTILGILPIALALGAGAESRVPMGVAVIGGLAFSTILTLFIIPAIYTYLTSKKGRLARV